MKKELLNFSVIPSVIPADKVSEVIIRGNGNHYRFLDEVTYNVTVCPKEYHDIPIDESFTIGGYEYKKFEIKPQNGALKIKYNFVSEQEWELVVSLSETEAERFKKLQKEVHLNANTEELEKGMTFSVYSLNKDLYERRPYAGDMHIHSNYSDGKENPEIVVSNLRRFGYDYCAITDHHYYDSSLKAIEKLKELKTNFKAYPGEEVHNKDMGRFHIVNFGGKISVNDMILSEIEKYNERVRKEAESIKGLSPIDALEVAWYKTITDDIRAGGGISIYAHPYWTYNHTYNCPTHITKEVLKRGYFDAYELLGGCTPSENNLETALYNELRAEGIEIPAVGSTDCHSCQIKGKNAASAAKTIVFAKNINDILESVKGLYSVAAETLENENPRVYGQFRFVKYAIFLMQNYFPVHDMLCEASGTLMGEYYRGEKQLKEAVRLTEIRIKEYEKEFFGEK